MFNRSSFLLLFLFNDVLWTNTVISWSFVPLFGFIEARFIVKNGQKDPIPFSRGEKWILNSRNIVHSATLRAKKCDFSFFPPNSLFSGHILDIVSWRNTFSLIFIKHLVLVHVWNVDRYKFPNSSVKTDEALKNFASLKQYHDKFTAFLSPWLEIKSLMLL